MAKRPTKYKKSKAQKEKEKKARLEKKREKKLRLKEKEKAKEKTRRERNKRRREKHRRERMAYLKEQARIAKILNKPVQDNERTVYKILFAANGSQSEYKGVYYSLMDAYEAFNELVESHSSVVFPRRVMNSHGNHLAVYEYLLLEKTDGEERESVLRNEFGKLVKHKTTSDKWTIIDKRMVEVEETFWVFGYDPRYDRKTFSWVYDNLIYSPIKNGDKYDNKLVILYGNKVLIKSDDGTLDMIITKTRGEGIRFYNKISEFVERDRIKNNVLLMGACGGYTTYTQNVIQEIMELTGWDKRKIVRMTTSG